MNPPEGQPQPNFVTRLCEHCGGKIEFDASGVEIGEIYKYDCPHCHSPLTYLAPYQVPPVIKEFERQKEREQTLPPTMIRLPEGKETTAEAQAFIGQERVKARLALAFDAASHRQERMPHTLLLGAPGGGTSLFAFVTAIAVGKLVGKSAFATKGSVIKNIYDLALTLGHLEDGEILVIDKIDQLQKSMAEPLRVALEHFILDMGEARLKLPAFSLIATVTRKEQLPPPLLASFPILERMDDYTVKELVAIANRFAAEMNLEIQENAAEQIVRSNCKTPKDVLQRLRHVRDFAHVKASTGKVTAAIAAEALRLLAPCEQGNEATSGRLAIPSDVRREVWRRDGGKCVKCGSREKLHYDHIIPVSKGGGNTARNIELLCEVCNLEKSDSIQ